MSPASKEKVASGQEREILAGPVATRQVSLHRLGKAPPERPSSRVTGLRYLNADAETDWMSKPH